MTDLRTRMRVFDEVPAPDYWSEVELRASAVSVGAARRDRESRLTLLLVAALLVILAISAAVVVGSGLLKLPAVLPLPSPSGSPTSPIASPDWVQYMPGTNPNGAPPGVYGTVVAPTERGGWTRGMHNVVEGPEGINDPNFRQTQLTFGAADDCFAGAEGPEPVPVTIAGLHGLYVEPYDDLSVQFGGPRNSLTTGAYALLVGDQTLCVYLSWDATTTAEELDAARQVVESIRARRFQQTDGIQIEFTLPAGWDTG